jgi:lysophospholipase L1-like esterase
MPSEGATILSYHTEAKERMRQAVNQWIRTNRAFDGVIDFDAVVRAPDHPSRLLSRLASDDHLHPNDAGYQRWLKRSTTLFSHSVASMGHLRGNTRLTQATLGYEAA